MRFAQGKLREGSVASGSEILRCAQDDRAGPCWWSDCLSQFSSRIPVERKSSSDMDPFEQSLQVEPAFPQCFPAGWAVPFTSQIAAIAGNRVPTLLGGQLGGWHLSQGGDDLHEVRRQHLEGLLLRTLPGRCPQLQQSHRGGRQQTQQAAQALVTLQLSQFDATPRFQAL